VGGAEEPGTVAEGGTPAAVDTASAGAEISDDRASAHHAPAVIDPVTSFYVRGPWFGAGQRAALAWVAGVLIGLVVIEAQVPSRSQPAPRPLAAARTVRVVRIARGSTPGATLQLLDLRLNGQPATQPAGPRAAASIQASSASGTSNRETALMIDSGGAGRYVLFAHDRHRSRLGGDASCPVCHHRNVAPEIGTPCTRCHQDMYRVTDLFGHAAHVDATDGRAGCAGCHPAGSGKTRQASRACDDCHPPVPAGTTRVVVGMDLPRGVAPGYRDAMHGLCIPCHREADAEAASSSADRIELHTGTPPANLALCSTCHRPEFERGAPRPQPLPDPTVTTAAAGRMPDPRRSPGTVPCRTGGSAAGD
jgi:hypothetical protein